MFLTALSSLIQHPSILDATSFETQRYGEKIKLLLRRHIVVNFHWITLMLIAALIPILIYVFWDVLKLMFGIESTVFQWLQLTSAELVIIIISYYLLIGLYSFIKFLEWFFNVLIISTHRVVDINYLPPFHRQTVQAQLEEIQDIRETQHGIFAVLFNYGNIFIQTAGTNQNIYLKRVPQPRTIHNLLINLMRDT